MGRLGYGPKVAFPAHMNANPRTPQDTGRFEGFRDRRDAGRRLAVALEHLAGENPLVLALPRGGVPVAAEVARALRAPLDVFVVRKIGAPFQPELGLGAIAEDGTMYLNREVCGLVGAEDSDIQLIARRERAEAQRRVRRYRGDRALPSLEGRTVILVDDGVATGGTAFAALRALRVRRPRRLVFAAPVGARETLAMLEREADEVVVVGRPEELSAIGAWYDDFRQVGDDEVVDSLEQAPRRDGGVAAKQDVTIPAGSVELQGHLAVPAGASGIVLFVHGSGSSRFSPRNRFVADVLRSAGLATLLFDFLTPDEEAVDQVTAELRFDIEFLARRLALVTDWVERNASTRHLRVGYFGASTGAAAALIAAAARPSVAAVVSRGGRPDLAKEALARVRAPTLLLVGGEDAGVIELNQEAYAMLRCEKKLFIVPGATHLFEEPGTLERVAERAASWFVRHLSSGMAARDRDRDER